MPDITPKPAEDAAAVKEIARLATAGLQVAPIEWEAGYGPQGYVVVPPGHSAIPVSSLFREALNESPLRVRRTITLDDPASFATYWHTYKNGSSLIFASEKDATITGVIDAEVPTGEKVVPRWGDHRIKLQMVESEEFAKWKKQSGTPQKQSDFAIFIEDNAPDIEAPSPATMIEIARTLEGTTESKFTGAIREKDGSHRMNYETVVSMSAGEKGSIRIPDAFTIAIPIFTRGPLVSITARLRYRIHNGGCSMWYDLLRPASARQDAISAAVAQVAEKCGQQVLFGEYGAHPGASGH